MRMIFPLGFERFRVQLHRDYRSRPGDLHGTFQIGLLRIISSGHAPPGSWEHVSVSTENRCPTWDEMQRVKEIFWSDDETVVQFHPRRSDYVNCCKFCLHLWKKVGVDHELPPKDLL